MIVKKEIDFNVDIKLNRNCIEGKIICDEIKEGDLFLFYLIKDGHKIYQTEWNSSKNFNYELRESGIYYLYGYIKRNKVNYLKKSFSMAFYNTKDINNFKKFCNADVPITEINNKLTYKKSEYPNQDFGLISYKYNFDINKIILRDFIAENNFQCLENSNSDHKYPFMVFADNIIDSNDKKYIFSGTTMINNKYVDGYKELDDKLVSKIYGNIGTFSLIEINNDYIQISNDFFNFSPIFYYEDENISIVSNRYHLLLVLMNLIGIKGEIDVEKVILNISNDNFMMQQNISHKMDIKGCRQVYNSKDCIIKNGILYFCDNEYADILRRPYCINENQYNYLIKEGINDIITQLEVLVSDERFRNVIVDLSGGLDSRIVYSALTNMEHNKNVKIFAKDQGGDLPIALQINNIYGYEYDDVPNDIKILSLKDADMIERSFFIGQYYSHNLLNAYTYSKAIRCVGAMGEAIYRTVYSRLINSSNSGLKEYIDDAFLWLNSNSIVSYEKVFEKFHKYFYEELSEIGGYSSSEKIDRFYLELRHGYHFSIMHPLKSCNRTWYPLQSKKIFLLQHLLYDSLSNIELQIDIINKLNPLLIWIPFENKQDNDAFNSIKDTIETKEVFKNINIANEKDRSNYSKAYVDKNKNKKIIGGNQFNQEYLDIDMKVYTACLYNLKKLFKYIPYIKHEIGIDLYTYIVKYKSNKSKIRFIYNKITSLIDQIEIFKNN